MAAASSSSPPAAEDPRLKSFQDNAERNAALLRLLTAADLALPCDSIDDSASSSGTIAQALAGLIAYRADWISHISPKIAASIPKPLLLHSPQAFLTALRIADGAAVSAVQELRTASGKPKFNPVLRSGPKELWMRTVIRDFRVRDAIIASLGKAGRNSKALQDLNRN